MTDMEGNLVQQEMSSYTESDLTRFRKLGRDSFKSYLKIGADYLDFIKNVTRYYSIDLPKSINEYLIRIETAPLFWIADIPTLQAVEEYFNNLNKAGGPKYYQDLKKYYSRWVTQKSERDKQYYTMSAFNILEKDPVKNHVLKKILHANLITFNSRQVASDKAFQLLEDADRILEKTSLSQNVKDELHYLIQLYIGFVFLKSGAFSEAQNKFEEASFIKQNGVSALFYNALVNVKLQNYDSASSLLSHIIDYDKERFSFAIKHRSINLLDFFLRNAVSYNIFLENDFVMILNDIEQLFLLQLGFDSGLLRQVILNISKLSNLKLKEFYDDSIPKRLEFLEKVSAQYRENTNILTSLITKIVLNEYEKTLDTIVENARKKFEAELMDEVKYFNKQISDNQKRISLLEEQLDKGNDGIEERLQSALKTITDDVERMVNELEKKLESMDDSAKFNPATSFKNSMVYNGIISMVVFMITGFAGGFMNNAQHFDNFSLVLTSTIIEGFKWGGVTYLVGTLVSLITAASTLFERTNEKQRLLRQISYVKNLGEKRKKEMHEAAKIQLETTEKGLQKQIENYRKKIEEIKLEKEEYKEKVEKEVIAKTEEVRTQLLPLYIS